MPLFLGDKPEVELTAKLRKERGPYQSLFRALVILKKQFGKDARGISLAVDTGKDNTNPGSFDPNKNRITLSLEAILAGVNRSPESKIKTPMLRGRGMESLM